MLTRSARLVKLARDNRQVQIIEKGENEENNNSTKSKTCEEAATRESPLPITFQTELIKLQELLGDVFNEDNETYEKETHSSELDSPGEELAVNCEKFITSLKSRSKNDADAIIDLSSLDLARKSNEDVVRNSASPELPRKINIDTINNSANSDIASETDEVATTDSTVASTNNEDALMIQPTGNVNHEDRTNVTPVASPPPPHDSCNDTFCITCSCNNDSPPILSNDDLYGNLPTPSVISTTSFNTPTSAKGVQTRQSSFKKDKGKKRLPHKEDWVVNKRKCAKNQGKSFINSKGKQIQEKQLGSPCYEKCRYKCSNKLDEKQRNNIFKKFWDLGSRQRQWEFVVRFTEKIPKRRQTTETTKHERKNTFNYFLPDENSEKIKVCKTMFLHTISAGERIIATSWQKCDKEIGVVSEDRRGKYQHKKRIMDDEMTRSVCDHVRSFSLVESHYIRKTSKKLYLEGVNSESRMYMLYDEWFDAEKYNNKANKRQYTDILKANFNIGFHKPKKDMCDVCHIYKNKEFPTEEEKTAYLKHQASKTAARHLKQLDKDEAKSNDDVLAATFDFEKVLITPHGDVSVFYYKRKLSTLNFTVYDLASKQATCFMWHEAIAKRGANEVSSCLYQYIKEHASRGIKTFKFWSDNCTGQNRNRIVFSLYLLAAKEFGVTISHRFMEKGHTQNEGDSVHSTIERASDRRLIYVPEEWYCLVRWAKVEGDPYMVREMERSEILDFKSLLLNKNWNKDVNNEKIQWTRIKEVVVHAQNFDRIEYKYNFDEAPKTIVVLRCGTRNQNRLSREFQIGQAYERELSISQKKLKDLLDLCKTGIIPDKYHSFYENLKSENETERISDDEEA